MRARWAAAVLAALTTSALGCRRAPAERIVYVRVTAPTPPTAAPTLTMLPADATPSPPPTPVFHTFTIEVPVSTPIPPDTSPPYEPPPEPLPTRPETLHDQMARCLDFSVERYTATAYTPVSIVAKVTVRNRCDVTFAGSETWAEVRAIPGSAGTAGRETGRFQSPIPPRGTAETLVQVNDVKPDEQSYRLEASLWWAAGGNRDAEH